MILGRIGAVFGVKGELKLHSFTEPKENILQYPNWLIHYQDVWQPVPLVRGKAHAKGLIVTLAGCDTCDRAQAFVGCHIAVPRQALPALDVDEYYWADLLGLTVVNTQGVCLGLVDRLVETGANDVLVVKGSKEHWVPFIWHQVIRSVNISEGRLVVDWDPGF